MCDVLLMSLANFKGKIRAVWVLDQSLEEQEEKSAKNRESFARVVSAVTIGNEKSNLIFGEIHFQVWRSC